MENLIVIFGHCGLHEEYTQWSVCWTASDEEADVVLQALRFQADAYYERFQRWRTERGADGARCRRQPEYAEVEDEFRALMLDLNFSACDEFKTQYSKRHIRPASTAMMLRMLPDLNQLVPMQLRPPQCAHVGSYRHYREVLDDDHYGNPDVRCDGDVGHKEDHEPICGDRACCPAPAERLPHFTTLGGEQRQAIPVVTSDWSGASVSVVGGEFDGAKGKVT
ncbi:MAG: hypothetical protein EPN91_12875 [Salinibacterium sp.]|nr:MAG: hypothetical protein EPN91_12875 [Salinibacterium sp.]